VDKKWLLEACKRCGLTRGAHNASSQVCPDHEGRMDWPKEVDRITVFEGSGVFFEIKVGTGRSRRCIMDGTLEKEMDDE